MNLGRVVKYLMLGFETWKFYIQVISFDTHLDLFIKSLISNSPTHFETDQLAHKDEIFTIFLPHLILFVFLFFSYYHRVAKYTDTYTLFWGQTTKNLK